MSARVDAVEKVGFLVVLRSGVVPMRLISHGRAAMRWDFDFEKSLRTASPCRLHHQLAGAVEGGPTRGVHGGE